MLTPITRRQALKTTAAGFGYLALAGLLDAQQRREAPLAPRQPHYPVRAKRIIFCFMEGAMSQLDTFEYKPRLQRDDQRVAPGGAILTASKFRFARHGQTGTWVSKSLPAHGSARRQVLLHPWPAHRYAGPSASRHPASHRHGPRAAHPAVDGRLAALWPGHREPGPARLHHDQPVPQLRRGHELWHRVPPRTFQGTRVSDTGVIPNLRPSTPSSLQRRQLELIQSMNRDLAAAPGAPDAVEGVIQSYELAFRMQDRVPQLLDISREPQHVLDMYGVQDGPQGSFARQCLMARRLSEAGVRFVEITQSGWDHHNNLHQGLISQSRMVDQPVAALLTDLERRGLLDETLVLFGSEFGRMPTAQGPDGRDHNITGYPMWLAGGGVKAGYSYGETDEYGLNGVDGRMHTTDLHATLLALMGLDHEMLTYRYAGRDFRLTDVAGHVVNEIFD